MMKKSLFALALWCSLTARAAEPNSTVLRMGSDRVVVLTQKGTDFGFFSPETSGYLKTGLMLGNQSLWLKDAKSLQSISINRGWELLVKDPILGTGELRFQVQPLTDCNGLILQVVGKNLPVGLKLLWAYGGGSADTLPAEKTTFLQPEQCRDNVFSREINAFTMYYGTTARLKVMMGVMPLQTETRLSDARQMTSPFNFWNSGKKTDAPALAGSNLLVNNEIYYYCIYRQNKLADYNYYMLPALFQKEAAFKTTPTNEKEKPLSNFGPDFHQQ
ncbi:MAG TPA: DUF4450 domain-containing protein [Bacteroidales bacterium]|nr:DUF4450 domain-containing protein [Bacteroidales bacterium]